MSNGTGSFGGLTGSFFQRTGNSGVRPREPRENPWAGHADFETPAPPTRSSLPHDRSTARPGRFRRLAIAGGPRAFHPAAQPSIGRPLPISRGHTSLFSPPGGAGAQYLLGNVLFVMAITYVGDALPIACCNRIHGWEAIARKSSGRLSSAMPVRWKMTRSPIEAGRRRV